jgi:hypothetical protein
MADVQRSDLPAVITIQQREGIIEESDRRSGDVRWIHGSSSSNQYAALKAQRPG